MGRTDKKCDKSKKDEIDAKSARIRKLCVKDVKVAASLTGKDASFTTLVADSANIKDLSVSSLSGLADPSFTQETTIIPVAYSNGLPQQPNTPGFDTDLANVLWGFGVIEQLFVETNASSGRIRNTILNNFYSCSPVCPPYDLSDCDCPVPGYAVFQGSVSGQTLTVTSIENDSLTVCPPVQGVIEIGQLLYTNNNSLLETEIISQETGVTGGVGTYTVQNSFDDYTKSYTGKMLSLSNLKENNCEAIPLRIFGSELISLSRMDSNNNMSVMSNISYSLNIVNRSLTPKVAAVYIQLGWKNGEGAVELQQIEVDTRQFEPSILSFGELMENTIFLPTELIESIAAYNMFSDVVKAAAQIIVYIEDGMDVLRVPTGPFDPATSQRNTLSLPRLTRVARREELWAKYSTSYVYGNYLVEIYDIPPNTASCRIQAGAGGGGGGSIKRNDRNFNASTSGGAGGGGSGVVADITLNLLGFNQIGGQVFNLQGATQIQVLIGYGGFPDQSGFPTIINFWNGVSTLYSLTLTGGTHGRGPFAIGGEGGDGFYGGGGGNSYTSTGVFGGSGGTGYAGTVGANGETGGYSGGDGGAPPGQQGGKGAKNIIPPLQGETSLGGGGGGVGGGYGGGGIPVPFGGDGGTDNGGDATAPSSGGGGAGRVEGTGFGFTSSGGKGGNGFFQVQFL